MPFSVDPIVTIGLPVFNGESHIRKAIDSVLSQSFTQFILVIADNHSTDQTFSIINEYKILDPRIIVSRHPYNIGGLENLFSLTKNVKTPYFMWFAHDDTMEKDFLKTCINIFNANKDIDMSFTSIRNIDFYGKSIREYPFFSKLPHNSNTLGLIDFVLKPEMCGQANLFYSLYKTPFLIKSLSENREFLNTQWGPDLAFLYSLLASGAKVKISSAVLFNKRSFQPESEIGKPIFVPKSYFNKSVKASEYLPLRSAYMKATLKHNRSRVIILVLFSRHLYLLLLRKFFDMVLLINKVTMDIIHKISTILLIFFYKIKSLSQILFCGFSFLKSYIIRIIK